MSSPAAGEGRLSHLMRANFKLYCRPPSLCGGGTQRSQTLPALQRAGLVPNITRESGRDGDMGTSAEVAKVGSKVQCGECGRTGAAAAVSF